MATCPKCGAHLNFWNVKAECPVCGVNIPNYDWENRLLADAENAEQAWKKFRVFTGNLKSALFGSKLRIIRFVCTFLPLIALVLPIVDCSLNLPFTGNGPGKISLLTFTLNYFTSVNWGSLIGLTGSDAVGSSFVCILLTVLLLYLAVVFGVLNFLFVLLKAPSLKAGINTVLCVLSLICFGTAALTFIIGVSQASSTTVNYISGSLQYGIFVGIALFGLNVFLNAVVSKGFKKERHKTAE